MQNFQRLIELLQLESHPEGGWYKEVYRSEARHQTDGDVFPSGRNFATAIYFLITAGNFSAFHRIKSDETWHFYSGDAIEVIEINKEGSLIKTILGSNIVEGHVFQYTVQGGNWFASRVYDKGNWSLTGCTVAPGFDFRDFEMAKRAQLLHDFPQHQKIITDLTRV